MTVSKLVSHLANRRLLSSFIKSCSAWATFTPRGSFIETLNCKISCLTVKTWIISTLRLLILVSQNRFLSGKNLTSNAARPTIWLLNWFWATNTNLKLTYGQQESLLSSCLQGFIRSLAKIDIKLERIFLIKNLPLMDLNGMAFRKMPRILLSKHWKEIRI